MGKPSFYDEYLRQSGARPVPVTIDPGFASEKRLSRENYDPTVVPEPMPGNPGYIDHTEPSYLDRARQAVAGYDAAQDKLIDKLRDKTKDVDWKGAAKKAALLAAGPVGWGKLANDAVASNANRDQEGVPKPDGREPSPETQQIQGQQGPNAWGTPSQEQAQGAGEAPERGKYEFAIEPSAAERGGGRGGGGGSGLSDKQRAAMAAGNVGITPELAGAVSRERGHLEETAAEVKARQVGMEQGILDMVQAKRDAAAQEEAKAQAVRDLTNKRMADEEKVRAMLSRASDISVDRAWEDAGEGAKVRAGIGLVISGLAGTQAVQSTANMINQQIDRRVDAQWKSYQAKLGLSREIAAQWDTRMSALKDEYAAKTSAKLQLFEGAKAYVDGQMDLAKTDEARGRLMQLSDDLAKQMAEHQQKMAEATAQQEYKLIHEREQASAAAARQQAAWAREDRHRKEDANLKVELQDRALDEKGYEASAKRSAQQFADSRQGQAAMRDYARHRSEIEPMIQLADHIRNTTLAGGEDGDVIPGYTLKDQVLAKSQYGMKLMSPEARANRQLVQSYNDLALQAQSGKVVTDKERVSKAQNLIASGKRKEILEGIKILDDTLREARTQMGGELNDYQRAEFERRIGRERSQYGAK
jgi:hypothetical protein